MIMSKNNHRTCFQTKQKAEKLAMRHWCEGRTRNALVKGEGVVCLHCPLPPNSAGCGNMPLHRFRVLLNSRGGALSQPRVPNMTKYYSGCCRRRTSCFVRTASVFSATLPPTSIALPSPRHSRRSGLYLKHHRLVRLSALILSSA